MDAWFTNRRALLLGLAAGLALMLSATALAQTAPIATLDSGVIEGIAGNDVAAFKGIPFAAPPLGNLRWRAPQPVAAWTGTRKATAFGADCTQQPEASDAAPLGTKPSEDCLVLNVWRPAVPPGGAPLPVMVWIHGGGYVNGGSSAAVYDGSAFARQGIVFVSINYRLGRLGFFSHPALAAANEGPVGNFGLMDQIAALHWVRRNIAAFGGNPNAVTLIGESAGGASVLHLLTSPEAKGLFHRAVVMSGGGRLPLLGGLKLSGGSAQAPSADLIGVAFARGLGINGVGAPALAALRALPAEKVIGGLNMSTAVKLLLARTPPAYAMGPVIDGRIVTDAPGAVFKRGEAANVPLLIGTTTADLPTTFPPLKPSPFAFFGADAKAALALYNPDGKRTPQQMVLGIGVDMTMHEPARFLAGRVTAAGSAAWLYRFGYVVESLRAKVPAAGHATELPFLFDTLAARYGGAASDQDRAAARAFNAYVANFAKAGDPNGAGLPPWPKFDAATQPLMAFTSDRGPVAGPDPWKARLDLVERAVEARSAALAQPAPKTLAGTAWQLVSFRGGDDRTLTPDDKAKYTIAFAAGNAATFRIDCNRGRGTWQSPAQGQLRFGPIATTKAMCPPGSLHDRVARDLPFVRGYVLKDGKLYLSLMADAGIYEFEPRKAP